MRTDALPVCFVARSESVEDALIVRLGECADAVVSDLANIFRTALQESGVDTRSVCSRLLIVTVHAAFVQSVANNGIPVKYLGKPLSECRTFTASEREDLLQLLQSPDPKLRFIALPLLDLPHVMPADRSIALTALLGDPEPQIREAAVRMFG
jgi:hypothetical protein